MCTFLHARPSSAQHMHSCWYQRAYTSVLNHGTPACVQAQQEFGVQIRGDGTVALWLANPLTIYLTPHADGRFVAARAASLQHGRGTRVVRSVCARERVCVCVCMCVQGPAQSRHTDQYTRVLNRATSWRQGCTESKPRGLPR